MTCLDYTSEVMDLSPLAPYRPFRAFRIEPNSLIHHAPDEPLCVFAGKLWPDRIPVPEDPSAEAPYVYADPGLLLGYILYAQPVWRRRMLYAEALHNLCLSHPDSDELHNERGRFIRALESDLVRRGLLGPDSQVSQQSDGHWRWYGPQPETGEPAVNALGAHEVRVYRLLWPLVRPHTRMLLHRIPQRQCPDDEHPCVNPEHFSYFTQRKPALRGWLNRDGTRSERRTTTGLPAASQRWHVGHDGRRYCNRAQHPLAIRYQGDAVPPATVYCRLCKVDRDEAMYNPVRMRPPSEELIRESEKLMQMVHDKNAQSEAQALPPAQVESFDASKLFLFEDESA